MSETVAQIPRCIWIDLETTAQGRILKVGAFLGEDRLLAQSVSAIPQVLRALDRLAPQADAVAGHNLWEHDLRWLFEQFRNLRLHALPVIDTLPLSPLCFPKNPYHHLVKDYKLVAASVSNPLEDAVLAATLFQDEVAALQQMADSDPEFFQLIRTLLAAPNNLLSQGMALLIQSLSDPPPPLPETDILPTIERLFVANLCRTVLRQFKPPSVDAIDQRWALAHTLSWVRVAGGTSVLPPWVRHRHPETLQWLQAWRDKPCGDPDCQWCAEIHNPERQLKHYMNLDSFLATPSASDGESLQRAITLGGMKDESMLAILPTGGGKSLCYQLPALIRHHRRGQLTVVISPLQALMKDQVDGLIRRTGLQNVAALYGLLTLPERGDVMRRITQGDLALLYLSPEQLRSRRVQKTLATREIGCWVIDEAHCLSKWGHDFRPDYVYAGRFIRELAIEQQLPMPPIACFTATAKQDVIDELIRFFRTETGVELIRYGEDNKRENLNFYVQTVGPHNKLPRIHDLLSERLDPEAPVGSGVVFRSYREYTRETAEFLRAKGWRVEHFHGGLTAPEKKRIQDAFLAGEIQVICATNAFGMGIDKEDVRVVIHGDTPGSIENYLQEAGRAGRDRHPADCILLYNEEDLEEQFRLGSFTQLSRKDIAQILRGLRTASSKRSSEEVVITTGEILRDEELEINIDAADRSADNRVRTALSWLERAGFIERNENRTQVIQASLLVRSMAEADAKLARLDLSEREAGLWRAVLQHMMAADNMDQITIDEIALLPEFAPYAQQPTGNAVLRERSDTAYVSKKILTILHAMNEAQLIRKDTLMTAYIDYKVANHSGIRLERSRAVEQALIGLLEELEPDPEGWLPLNTRLLSDALQQRSVEASPELVRKLLHSVGADGRGFAAHTGSLELRPAGRDQYRVRILRPWTQIKELSARRLRISEHILALLIGKVSAETSPQKDVLVEFAFEEIEQRLKTDGVLYAAIKDVLVAIERGLLYLHEQQIIVLQQGLSIFLSAMTVKVFPDRKRMYTVQDYEPLDHYYRERIFQVHVMNDYAQRGLKQIQEALQLVVSYFSMPKEAFIEAFFSRKRQWLERATTERSYRNIVDELANKQQIRIVTAPLNKNLLILAGPGSGKTRVVVHRCAYLLRVRRVRPRSILVCCFNHKAAVELRRRLNALVGSDARSVTVQTYHSLALRLLGRSSIPQDGETEPDFDGMIRDAIAVLKGDVIPVGMEADDVRDRLLAGYEHILVDEYQDINASQYELISAIAGRTEEDDRKLNILAVGDDDQNIYTFCGANIEFIRRFQKDYHADVTYLTENYRSTRYIIEAANALIEHNRDRMKTRQPIHINESRALLPPGGLFGAGDALTRGRVSLVQVPDQRSQADAIVSEINRLRSMGVESYADIAVLSRHRIDLAAVRAVAESQGVPVAWPMDPKRVPRLHRFREIRCYLDIWRCRASESVAAGECIESIREALQTEPENHWLLLLLDVLEEWQEISGGEPVPLADAVDYVYESLAQRRRDEQWGRGVTLNTVHSAKGTEYPHVLLCGAWGAMNPRELEEERRLYYVGMTRAMQSLCLFQRTGRPNRFMKECQGAWTLDRPFAEYPRIPQSDLFDSRVISLEDLFIGYAGRFPDGHSVHQALKQLRQGDSLSAVGVGDRIELRTTNQVPIAQISKKSVEKWFPKVDTILQIRVLGLFTRYRADETDPKYLPQILASQWEIPICEVRWRGKSVGSSADSKMKGIE